MASSRSETDRWKAICWCSWRGRSPGLSEWGEYSREPDENIVWTSLLHAGLNHARIADVSVFHTQVPEASRVRRSLLVKEGFSHVRTYWNMHWEPYQLSQPGLVTGMNFRPLILGQDEGDLTKLQNAAFGNNWGFCPNTQEEIEGRVRFNTMDPEDIILLESNGRAVGYNWTSFFNAESGPVGRIEMTRRTPRHERQGARQSGGYSRPGALALKGGGACGVGSGLCQPSRYAALRGAGLPV